MPDHDQRTDTELIHAINNGDDTAFETLYFRYRNWVHALALRMTGNHDDALDVLQDTFTYLINKFPGFQLSAQTKTFLYPVVKHLCLARLRKKKPTAIPDEDLEDLIPAAFDETLPDRQELSIVLERLPASHREVLLMRFCDDMPIAEIAAALNIPPGTVKSRLHNALAALRDDPQTRSYFNQ